LIAGISLCEVRRELSARQLAVGTLQGLPDRQENSLFDHFRELYDRQDNSLFEHFKELLDRQNNSVSEPFRELPDRPDNSLFEQFRDYPIGRTTHCRNPSGVTQSAGQLVVGALQGVTRSAKLAVRVLKGLPDRQENSVSEPFRELPSRKDKSLSYIPEDDIL
jgi:hypothetical protein